jgi:AraC-like DNA-binding protein
VAVVSAHSAAGFTGRRLARHAAANGLPDDRVASWLGLTREQLACDPLPRIPMERLYGAWAALSRELGDPAVGVRAARGWTVADLDLYGFCVATAPTGAAAASTAARYVALVTSSGRWHMEERPAEVELTWRRSGPPTLGRAISNEVAVASFAVCFAELTSSWPLWIELRHRPPRPAAHRDLLGCPIRFGGERDAVVLSRRALEVVPRQANAPLWRFLSALADGELHQVGPAGARARVERALVEALDAGAEVERLPSVGDVARALGMSERSLRRRLREERTSFRALLDEVRRGRAAELLAESTRSVTEVALAAGFSGASGLGHAWQRWFGRAPSAGRRGPGKPG